ncbi:UDP-N-acetylmuramate--L-alanine ligase [Thermus filiformis]|uniref:UDP-N-acetylmuramate--L-alanine ligase n=1 Tax=Thermus filiformis TaxID=276 RepID=A0A0A2X962_THEFI|nr:UDP-N-acetylmuramate--L-alanine ligase [Thermus filiformis]KGQ21699.1 UDP-N-acetylmuramate--alanine ligase [Thermus filiformis]
MKVHVMGLEGVGMSALARLLLAEGHGVTGCDLAPGSRCQALLALGAGPVHRGHDPGHLQDEDTLLLPTPIPEDHPEVQEARRRGLRVLHRMELLRDLLAQRPSLGVTGTHGKTTTTGMLASILLAAGLDPWVLLGGEVEPFGNARYGQGPRLAEVDESDPRFQEVRVDVAVVTNLEADHVSPDGRPRPNYHPSYEALMEAVLAFGRRAQALVFPASDPVLARLFRGLSAHPFGAGGEAWAEDLELLPFGSRFHLVHRGRRLGEVRLEVPGAHNVHNALAAGLAALLFGVPFPAVQAGLAQYRGARRRFERLGVYRGALLVDDYAHHPTEVRATLEAARSTGLKVKALFQPHRLGRTQSLWRAFAQSLLLAEEVLVLPVYTAGEEGDKEELARRIAQEVQSLGGKALFLRLEEARAYLEAQAGPGEVWVSLGAGDVNRILKALLGGEG